MRNKWNQVRAVMISVKLSNIISGISIQSKSTVWWINSYSQTLAENIETQDEERNSTSSGLQTPDSTHRPMGSPRPPLNPFLPSAKSDVLRREQKRTQSFKMEELPGPLITDQQNFSVETKQEPDYVSTATNIFCVLEECFSHLPLCYGVFLPLRVIKCFG